MNIRLYRLGKDANKHPLTENLFYIHNQTREIIQLFRDADGFRVEYGPGGRHANIFDLKNGVNYRPMTRDDFEKEIENSTKRKTWLKGGLLNISRQTTKKQIPNRMDAMDDYIPPIRN